MLQKSLDTIFKTKWRFLSGHILPIFSTTKSDSLKKGIEPCSLISSKPWKDYDLPDLAFVFTGVTPESEDNSSSQNTIEISSTSTISEPAERSKTGCGRFTGIFLALFATFIYSLATLIIKVFHNYHPFTLSIWRFQGMIIPSVPIMIYYKYGEKKLLFQSIWPLTERKKLKVVVFILLRSLLGCTSSILQIFAIKKLNMADASVIVFSSPVFVTLGAHMLLGEKAGFFSFLMALFTFFGVVVIARPPMITGASLDEDTLIGTGYAVGAMLMSAGVFVILRYLREVHYSLVTISYGVLGTIECLIMAAIFQVLDLPHGLWEWTMATGLILFTFLGQTAMVISLKFENAGPVSLVGTTDVVFAFLWQFLFLNVLPDLYSLIGACIVILGVVLTTFSKWVGTLPDDHPARIKLSWLLK